MLEILEDYQQNEWNTK